MKKYYKNKIRCKKCGTILESKHVHNYVECPCKTAADGGLYYKKRAWDPRLGTKEDVIEEIVEEITKGEYEDYGIKYMPKYIFIRLCRILTDSYTRSQEIYVFLNQHNINFSDDADPCMQGIEEIFETTFTEDECSLIFDWCYPMFKDEDFEIFMNDKTYVLETVYDLWNYLNDNYDELKEKKDDSCNQEKT